MTATWLDLELISALREELRRYLAAVEAGPLTEEEKADLCEWVADGNSVYDNPYYLCDDSGRPMSFIEGCRFAEWMREEYEDSFGKEPETADVGWDANDEDSPF